MTSLEDLYYRYYDLYEATVVKTVSINSPLSQLAIGLENGIS